jgi:hypothetical protein
LSRAHVSPQPGRALQEPPGVRVARRGEHLPHRPLLHDPAALHHDEPVGAVGGDPEVVGDQQDGRAGGADELVEAVEDVPLHGGVQRAGGFVRHEQLGAGGDRDRDEDALAHAAGQLVRVLPGPGLGVGQARLGEQLDGPGGGAAAVGQAVDRQHLGDLRPDPLHGVERDARVLRHEPDPPAAHGAPRPVGQAGELLLTEGDPAGVDPARSREQPRDGVGEGRLPGAGLADDRDDLPRRDGQRDAAHGRDGTARGGVGDPQVLHLQQRRGHRARSPSRAREIRFTASTAAAIAAPGTAHSHQATAM